MTTFMITQPPERGVTELFLKTNTDGRCAVHARSADGNDEMILSFEPNGTLYLYMLSNPGGLGLKMVNGRIRVDDNECKEACF